MPIDPSIISGLQQPKFDSPVNALAQMLKVQSMQQEGQMGRAKLDEYSRGVAGDNALSKLLAGGASPQDVATGLASQGYGKQAMAYTKQQNDAAQAAATTANMTGKTTKLASETKGLDYDLERKKHDRALTEITSFNSPTDALASLDAHVKSGELPPEQADAMRKEIPTDPAQFRDWQGRTVMGLLTAKDRMGFIAPDANAVLTAKTSRDNNAATVAQAERGSVRTAGTAAAGQAQSERHFQTTQENSKGQIVQSDDGPILVNTRDGTGKAVMGPDGKPLTGVTKPLNDSQSKALLFGTRMQEAHKILGTLAGEGTKTSVPGSRAPLIGSLINSVSPESQQMLDQAKRDFMTAVLRRESGASISPGEFDTADKQYFPQIGEPEKITAQKARNRELAINGILAEVPEKQRASITPKSAGSGPVKVVDAASYAKLPSGAEYIAPDGHTRRKP